jgi:hypothetical protein
MARVLVISFGEVPGDARVLRQIEALREDHALTVAAFGPGPPGLPSIEIAPGRRTPGDVLAQPARIALRILGAHPAAYWADSYVRRARRVLGELRPEVVIANDMAALPLALAVAQGAPVILDAHEYAPLEHEDDWRWRLVMARHARYLTRRYASRAAAMVTVSDGIAERYARDTGIEPIVITNARDFEDLVPTPVGDPVRLLHHGRAEPGRGIETLIAAMDHLGAGYTLDLMLLGDDGYQAALAARAGGDPRIRFVPPVKVSEIARFANAYDVGLYSLPPSSFNARHALPNKLFDYVQARLAVVVGPSPEMARLVTTIGCGAVAADFSATALAGAIAGLDIAACKQRAHAAAPDVAGERNAELLRATVAAVASGNP